MLNTGHMIEHPKPMPLTTTMTDDATTVATVALAAELELADPPGAPPFGFGAFFAAAAFGAALGSW